MILIAALVVLLLYLKTTTVLSHVSPLKPHVGVKGVCGKTSRGMWARVSGTPVWIVSVEGGAAAHIVMNVNTTRCPSGTALLRAQTALKIRHTGGQSTLDGDAALCVQRGVAEDEAVYRGICVESSN
jgi:hypothetical protein